MEADAVDGPQPDIGRDVVEMQRPPPSTMTETFAERREASEDATSACRKSCRDLAGVDRPFIRAEPDRGSGITGMPSFAGMPSAAISAANGPALASLRPRNWMLPREVTSTMPLP